MKGKVRNQFANLKIEFRFKINGLQIKNCLSVDLMPLNMVAMQVGTSFMLWSPMNACNRE